MKKAALMTILAAMLCSFAGGAATAEETRTLTGDYVWDQRGGSGDLKAIFTPVGPESWEVAFHFRFRSRPHVYQGTAEGSLSEGKLEGQVETENGRRKFSFTGQFRNGVFKGTHAEIFSRDEERTGTLTLSEGGGVAEAVHF